MERMFHLSFSLSLFIFLFPLTLLIYSSFSSSQSNWYDMSSGKCNLLLIKTCCWHRLFRLIMTHGSLPLILLPLFYHLIFPLLLLQLWLTHLSLFYLNSFLSTCTSCAFTLLSTLSCLLFPLVDSFSCTAVSAPWRGKESPQPGDHRPQQPPNGSEDHHQ